MEKGLLSSYTKKEFSILQSNMTSFSHNNRLSKINFSLMPKANEREPARNRSCRGEAE